MYDTFIMIDSIVSIMKYYASVCINITLLAMCYTIIVGGLYCTVLAHPQLIRIPPFVKGTHLQTNRGTIEAIITSSGTWMALCGFLQQL